jgi:Cu+-exporting ATPase
METADLTLLSGGLAAVPRAITLARATMQNVRQNLLLAFLYNILAIPVAAGVLYPLLGHVTSPMLAAAAMSLSSSPGRRSRRASLLKHVRPSLHEVSEYR